MKKLITLSTCIFCFIFISNAQQATVSGIVTDTINKENLHYSVISLLRAKDSVLYKFTRSKADGKFDLNHLDTGKYLVLVTHPKFADYVDHIELAENSRLNLGIKMTLMANLLEEVIVQQQIAAIRMRGDTTEFKADSFKVREGAPVEEMLKRLPGIQVDKDGKITAMGEKVQKVLVDGEEFFGDDPTVATKNIQADAIDKVQVFDKKSDQAAFTGIDDGEKNKTINLTLKEDKKKGYFGKLELGGGVNDRWSNNAMFNRFRAKQKISAYGIMSSTGKTGLNWDERNQYGGGMNTEYSDEGYIYFSDGGGGDDLGGQSYYGEGLPKSWSIGANYSNKFDLDKQNINGSYRYSHLNTEGAGNTIAQSILDPLHTQYSRDSGNSFNIKERHVANGTYEWQIDSFTSIKVMANGFTGTQSGFSNFNKQITNQDQQLINTSSRNTNFTGDSKRINSTWLLRKRFKKVGRTLSLNIDQLYNNGTNDSYLYAPVSTFINGIQKDSITDQRKLSENSNTTLGARIVYTEPVVKNLFAEVNYAIRNNKNDAALSSYDKIGDKYSDLNADFSNHYQFDVLTNTAGASLKYNGKKITANAGSNIAKTNFKQNDLIRNALTTRDYTNFFPKAGFTYKFNQYSRFSINYNGSTRQPSIQQIQPVKNNNDPLVIVEGNPFLKEEFNHSFYFNYNSYKVFNQRGIYMYGNFSTTANAIVSNNTTDIATGKTTLRYTNINGNYNGYSGLGYSMKLKKLDMYFNSGLNFSTNRYNNFINSKSNTTTTQSPGINFGFGKNKEKKYNIYFRTNFNYNLSKSTLNSMGDINYWTINQGLNINVTLPWKLEVNNDLNVNLRQKTVLSDRNNNVFLWNAYLGRKLLKNDKAMLKISGNDILNQNKGYNRFVNSNNITEKNYQTITRYFLLSFVWNFSKNPAMGNQ